MLGHPALVVGHGGGDAQRVALLAEQGVAAVAGAVAPDGALFGEVHDVLGVVARPRHVGLALFERGADGVQALDVAGVVTLDLLENLGADAGHDVHGDDDVRGVGDLHAVHRYFGLEVAHDEGDHVHRATLHRPPVEVGHDALHLLRVHPVVGGPSAVFGLRADVGAVFDARHVGGVGGRPVRVRLLGVVEFDERAAVDELLVQARDLLVGSGDPDDLCGRGEGCDLIDPGGELFVARSADCWNVCGHRHREYPFARVRVACVSRPRPTPRSRRGGASSLGATASSRAPVPRVRAQARR